jgi:hypothetical protein
MATAKSYYKYTIRNLSEFIRETQPMSKEVADNLANKIYDYLDVSGTIHLKNILIRPLRKEER